MRTTTQGKGIHVGIIDSLGAPPEEIRSHYDIIGVHDDYIDTDSRDTVGHGTTVTDLITNTAPEASFSTFQVIGNAEGESEPGGHRSNLIQAIQDAAEKGVDVLNLSLGVVHECGGRCAVSREAKLAADHDDVCVIAATGNQDDSVGRTGVHCPALSDSVIGVGGYYPICGNEIVRDESSEQWWLENEEIVGPFCGHRGCCSESSCEENRKDVLWERNISFHNTAPDVLAPVLEVHGNSLEEITVQAGTSFGTPLVVGLIAGILGDLAQSGTVPSIGKIRQAVRYSSTEIDEGGYNKFDAEETREWLTEECS